LRHCKYAAPQKVLLALPNAVEAVEPDVYDDYHVDGIIVNSDSKNSNKPSILYSMINSAIVYRGESFVKMGRLLVARTGKIYWISCNSKSMLD
jgi:hypothetical protein